MNREYILINPNLGKTTACLVGSGEKAIFVDGDFYNRYIKLRRNKDKTDQEELNIQEKDAQTKMRIAEHMQDEVKDKWREVDDLFSQVHEKLSNFNKVPPDRFKKISSINSTKDSSWEIIDDFEQARIKGKSKVFTLKRSVAGLVIGFGLFAAIKEAPKFFMNHHHHITIESPTMDNFTAENVSMEPKRQSKKSKSFKAANPKAVKISDNINLKDVNLYYTSKQGKPSLKVRKVDCDYYRINRIAVISGTNQDSVNVVEVNSKNMDVRIDDFIENYRLLYGENTQFQINVDAVKDGKVVCKEVGWTSIQNIKTKKVRKVYQKVK